MLDGNNDKHKNKWTLTSPNKLELLMSEKAQKIKYLNNCVLHFDLSELVDNLLN